MTIQAQDAISEAERLARLRLARSDSVGPITYRDLMARFETAESALDRLPELARRGGRRRPLRLCGAAEAEAELKRIAALGGRLLTRGEAGYPAALEAIEDAPPVLALLGDPALIERPAVAIVGARNASANGRRLAERLAAELGPQGFVIVSGLARGIDTAAHRGALRCGTLAVVAGGVDVCYPDENREIYEAIKSHGLILAEPPLETRPQARHFPRRNRIISGLSLGVVVVEAALRSGSLITARRALDQGRELFAVPGSPLEPRARGCNALLREGAAHLIESAEDILQVLKGPFAPPGVLREPPFPAPDGGPEAVAPAESALPAGTHDQLHDLLGPEPVAVDELVRRCHLSPAAVSTALLELELAGRLERHPGHRVSLRMTQDGPSESAPSA